MLCLVFELLHTIYLVAVAIPRIPCYRILQQFLAWTHLNKSQTNAQTTNYQQKFFWFIFKFGKATLFIWKVISLFKTSSIFSKFQLSIDVTR
jgi:hypothetical protein